MRALTPPVHLKVNSFEVYCSDSRTADTGNGGFARHEREHLQCSLGKNKVVV